MTYDLVHFHFNPIKTGQIIKQLCIDRGMSMASLAKKTGITYDTMDNIFRGRIQDMKFEALFKICCMLGLPIEVLMLLMLKDEDIDFMDHVLLYNNKEDEAFPVTDIDSVPSSVPNAVLAAAEAVAATESSSEPVRKSVENPEHIAYLHQHIDHLTKLLEIMINQQKGG